ncbi:hypothetical protein GCM10010350_75570 [Streptomyces galilaeus]|nr:hypothetical protein GCM10010350_75570 [Streptomyces galilaeus]
MLVDSGEAIADLALLRDQTEGFGSVASIPTAWRLLADVDKRALTFCARASAREVAWLQTAETGRAYRHPGRGTHAAGPHPGPRRPLVPLREGGSRTQAGVA